MTEALWWLWLGILLSELLRLLLLHNKLRSNLRCLLLGACLHQLLYLLRLLMHLGHLLWLIVLWLGLVGLLRRHHLSKLLLLLRVRLRRWLNLAKLLGLHRRLHHRLLWVLWMCLFDLGKLRC